MALDSEAPVLSASAQMIYLVDDEYSLRRALARLLRTRGYCVEAFELVLLSQRVGLD